VADAKQLNPPKTSPAVKTAFNAGKPLSLRNSKQQKRLDTWKGQRTLAR
jgi:hypothetical protein